jgi:hypothetical protein
LSTVTEGEKESMRWCKREVREGRASRAGWGAETLEADAGLFPRPETPLGNWGMATAPLPKYRIHHPAPNMSTLFDFGSLFSRALRQDDPQPEILRPQKFDRTSDRKNSIGRPI